MAENQSFHQDHTNSDQDWVNAIEQKCNFTQDKSGTHILPGYNNAESIIHWKFDNNRNWATDKAKLINDQGRCSYDDRKIKFLQGLVYWITDLSMRVNPIVLTDFDHQERDLAMYMACIHNNEGEARQANDKPENFKVNNWTDC